MTDLEKFIDFYECAGVDVYDENVDRWVENKEDAEINTVIVLCNDGANEKIGGYSGFSTAAFFDKDGKFLRQEFFE